MHAGRGRRLGGGLIVSPNWQDKSSQQKYRNQRRDVSASAQHFQTPLNPERQYPCTDRAGALIDFTTPQ
jgi:hypothetical protein